MQKTTGVYGILQSMRPRSHIVLLYLELGDTIKRVLYAPFRRSARNCSFRRKCFFEVNLEPEVPLFIACSISLFDMAAIVIYVNRVLTYVHCLDAYTYRTQLLSASFGSCPHYEVAGA